MHISELSARRPVATSMFVLSTILLGIFAFTQLSVDFLPHIDIPQIVIRTEFIGSDITNVEEQVTAPIESAMRSIHEVSKVKSVTRDGISFVTVQFAWGTKMDLAFINARSALDKITSMLPATCSRPVVMRFDPASMPIMSLTGTSKKIESPKSARELQVALVELKNVMQTLVKQRLEELDGVASVMVSGGLEREIRIVLDKDKCAALGIPIDQISTALAQANIMLSGGTVADGVKQYALRIESGLRSTDDIANVRIVDVPGKAVVYLKDIARVFDTFKEQTGATRINGKETVTVHVYKEAGANTVKTTKQIYGALQDLHEEYPEFTIVPVFDQSEFIRNSIDDVMSALILGGLLALILIFYFLADLRSSLLIGISIPLSVLITFIFMYLLNIQFNVISLSGLALGIGMLVDNSIVVIENIYRHRQEGKPLWEASLFGAQEVSLAIIASTVTTIVVFIPLVYIKGLAGQLFFDQSITITISLCASLLVALTVTVMLASRKRLFTFRNSRPKDPSKRDFSEKCNNSIVSINPPAGGLGGVNEKGSGVAKGFVEVGVIGSVIAFLKNIYGLFNNSVTAFQQGYEWINAQYMLLLHYCIKHRKQTLILAGILTLLSGAVLMSIDHELFPRVDYKELVVTLEMPTGTPFSVMQERTAQIERYLLKDQRVQYVLSTVGITKTLFDETWQPDVFKAMVEVKLRKGAKSDVFMNELNNLCSRYNDMSFAVSMRKNEFERMFKSQNKRTTSVMVSGENIDTLKTIALAYTNELRRQSPNIYVQSSLDKSKDELKLELDREKLVRSHISPDAFAAFIENHLKGVKSTQIDDQSEKIDITIAFTDIDNKTTLPQLLSLTYPVTRQENGSTIVSTMPVYNFVKPIVRQRTSEILRIDQNKVGILDVSIPDLSGNKTQQLLNATIQRIRVPAGYTVQAGLEQAELRSNFTNLIAIVLISVALVFFILCAQYESVKVPFVIMLSVPLSTVGVAIALAATGNSLNIMSLVGIIVAVGTVVNDSIIEIDFVHKFCKKGNDVITAILQARRVRFRPIMINTIVTVLGLLPMAILPGDGSELRHPLAWTIIGGLLMSLVLSCTVIPIAYTYIVQKPEDERTLDPLPTQGT